MAARFFLPKVDSWEKKRMEKKKGDTVSTRIALFQKS